MGGAVAEGLTAIWDELVDLARLFLSREAPRGLRDARSGRIGSVIGTG